MPRGNERPARSALTGKVSVEETSLAEPRLVEPLEEAGLVAVALAESPDPRLGLRGAAGPPGQVAQVDKQGDGAVVVLGACRGDQLLHLAPGRRLAAGQVV